MDISRGGSSRGVARAGRLAQGGSQGGLAWGRLAWGGSRGGSRGEAFVGQVSDLGGHDKTKFDQTLSDIGGLSRFIKPSSRKTGFRYYGAS